MEGVNLKALSDAISQQLHENIELVSVELAGKGFHAEGFKLTAKDGRVFFVKKIVTNADGFEFPERKLSALMLSHAMNRRTGLRPASFGVILEHDGAAISLNPISEGTSFYHVQEFGNEGVNYFSLLNERLNKKKIDEQDRAEIKNIVESIGSIHSIEPQVVDKKHLRAIYMDGLRAELVHPELTLSFVHSLDETHPVLPPAKQGNFIALYLKVIHDWKDRFERTRALHGDFWGSNTLVHKDGSISLIDFSRIPWGDPGIDIGRWMAQYVWLYLVSHNPYFKELGEFFLDTYTEQTGDKEIRKALTLGYVFPILIYSTLFTSEKEATRRKMFAHGCEILKKGEFFWPKNETIKEKRRR